MRRVRRSTIFLWSTAFNSRRLPLWAIDTEAITRIQDRIDEIYAEITTDELFRELDEAQAAVNELMATVNDTIMFNATGKLPSSCTHDCSTCGGCH